MQRRPLFFPIIATLAITSSASADDDAKRQCAAAYEHGQRLEHVDRLVQAREEWRTCARVCSKVFREQCNEWLETVRAPTIIPSIPDKGTKPSALEVDGAPLDLTTLGSELEIDPGEHVLRVAFAGGRSEERRIVVARGDRARSVVLDMHDAPPREDGAARSNGRRRLPWLAVALGGVGVLGLGTFATFGAIGRSKESDLEACSPRCPPSRIDAVRGDYHVADVGLVVGVAALVAATVLVLTDHPSPSTRLASSAAR